MLRKIRNSLRVLNFLEMVTGALIRASIPLYPVLYYNISNSLENLSNLNNQ